MILAATVTRSDAILVIAMAVVLILIVGVVSAMRRPSLQRSLPAKRTMAPIPVDNVQVDLEERLRAIVLPPKTAFANAVGVMPQVANFQTRPLDRSVGARLATGPITIRPPRPEEVRGLLGPRSALPGPVEGFPRLATPSRSTGSLPGLPALPSSGAQPTVVVMPPGAPPQGDAKTPQPFGGARQSSEQARQVEMAPPEGMRERATGDGLSARLAGASGSLPQLTGPLATGPGTRGFTVIPDEQEESSVSSEPSPFQDPAQPTGSESVGEASRVAEQASGAWPSAGDSGSLPGFGDGHERSGEVSISPPFAIDAPEFVPGPQPALTGAMSSSLDEDMAPVGAVPFSAELLHLTTPASAQLDAQALSDALGTTMPDVAPSPSTSPFAGVNSALAMFPDSAGPHSGPEDDQLSETHVFSTSDLYPTQMEEMDASIEQPQVIEQYAPPPPRPQPIPSLPNPQPPNPQPPQSLTPPSTQPPQRVAPPPNALPPIPVPASSGSQSSLLPMQEAQVRQLLDELANLPDVGFVKLLGPDGTVIVSADKSAADPATDEHIAVLIGFAIMEVQQLGLGDWTSMAVEAPGVALLLFPLSGGASLAILLSNPARLGLLRRQMRKPLAGLQEVLSSARAS